MCPNCGKKIKPEEIVTFTVTTESDNIISVDLCENCAQNEDVLEYWS